MFAVGGFLALSFCLRFTFAFSGSGSNAVPLGLCCGGSFSSHTVRFAFFRFDPGIFCCKAVGGFLFSGSTYAFGFGGVGFVYTALALGFFVCFTLGLGGRSADAFSLGFCFAFTFFRFTFFTIRFFAGTARFFFSGGLGFCFRFFAGFTFGLFRFSTGFGSSFFRRSALFFLTPRFFFG